jgi:hypothetical protein
VCLGLDGKKRNLEIQGTEIKTGLFQTTLSLGMDTGHMEVRETQYRIISGLELFDIQAEAWMFQTWEMEAEIEKANVFLH